MTILRPSLVLEAHLRAQQFDKAEDMLRSRLKRRVSVRDTFWLGRAQQVEGYFEAARTTFTEVAQRWQGVDPKAPEQRRFIVMESGI